MAEEGHRVTNDLLVRGVADAEGLAVDDEAELRRRIEVVDFQVSDGSAKGDNFACVMKAVEVKAKVDGGQVKAFHFMAKSIPMNPFREKFVTKANIFGKELQVYQEIFPAFEKFCKAEKLAVPRCHFGSIESKVILMENLKTSGYRMEDKRKGLPLRHARMVLDQLALFHAASYHWMHSYPGGLAKFKSDHEVFFHDDHLSHGDEDSKTKYETMLTNIFLSATGIVAKGDEELGRKMTNFSEKLLVVLRNTTKPCGFCVLCHGDCWTNNIMFLYDGNALTSLKMLDFQMTRYARPSLDLVYFLSSSISPETRLEHLDDLLLHYHTTFVHHLTSFGHDDKVFQFDDLKNQYNDCFAFGFVFGTFVTQLMLAEKFTQAGGGFDMDNMTSEEDAEEAMKTMQQKMMTDEGDNTLLRDRLVSLAREALKRGVMV